MFTKEEQKAIAGLAGREYNPYREEVLWNLFRKLQTASKDFQRYQRRMYWLTVAAFAAGLLLAFLLVKLFPPS